MSMKNFEDLKQSFKDGRLIPFVGAAFTMVDPAAPSWNGLLDLLARDLTNGHKKIFKDLPDFLEQAEYYCKVKGKRNIATKINDILNNHPANGVSLKPHELLLRNFDRIYTTNYDKYFETVANRLNIDIQNVPEVSGSSSRHLYIIRNASSNRMPCANRMAQCASHAGARRLVKYHGDYRITDSLILTETSYFKRLLDFDAKDILFASDALFYDFIFLGYGFADISLKYTLQQLERTFETLGNVVDKKSGSRSRAPRFFILRTDNRLRNRYQDKAYKLRSISMAEFVDDDICDSSGNILQSFYSKKPRVSEVGGKFGFSSFQAVWDCAEKRWCCCKCSGCTETHLDDVSSGRKNDVNDAAKELRAYILNEGFTKFLTELGCTEDLQP